MSCACTTGHRRLRIHLKNIDKDLAHELSRLQHWHELGTWEWLVDIGGKSPYQTVEDLACFLEVCAGVSATKAAYSRWESNAPSGCCSRLAEPTGADDVAADLQPLEAMCVRGSSALIPVLRQQGIETHFQPIVHADGTTIWGYECLMRGSSREGELISPAQLLEWARSENLLSMLDRVCRETHLRNAAQRVPTGKAILINFVPTAIYEPIFCLRSTMKVLEQTGINPNDVIFEVVETELVRDTRHLKNILDVYRANGLRTALDDLGAGFSGLTLLAELQPDLLKLDIDLVQGAAEHFHHRVIVQGIVQIAKNCGQQVLAEGIETQEQFELLRDLGVDLFQGYFFGRPSSQPVMQIAERPSASSGILAPAKSSNP